MGSVKYIEKNGTEHVVDVPNGMSLMEGAIINNVPGIEGDCGGLCACATCHVYVPADWQDRCGEREELEENILDFAWDVDDSSRLACQIHMSDDLEGIVINLPERQY